MSRTETRDARRDENGDEKGGGGEPAEVALAPVVDALCVATGGIAAAGRAARGRMLLPSRTAVHEMVELLRSVFFPGYFGTADLDSESLHFYIGAAVDRVLHALEEQAKRGLCFVADHDPVTCRACDARAREVARAFLAALPGVRERLATDVRAAYEGDPAATSTAETIFCYPGLSAILSYRLAHELYRLEVPLIPRIITEEAHGSTGIDIHPGAEIGERFFIDHGTGIVIGETCEIGANVRIYQGVTLGAKSFALDADGRPIKGVKRHPIVEDDVIIYSGATILGRVVIGRGSTIGGNVWLTESVPPGSRVTQVRARGHIFEEGGGI